jgi:cation diffusion facilitator CzcD-associated flavoprotein CzcO
VTAAEWDTGQRCWRIETTRGTLTAEVLVNAAGPLSEPALPDIPGLDTFSGTVFHSARWNHDHDLTGRRVAVIGTGASAAQFVPAIAPQVGRLDLYQRTPAWVIPRKDRSLSPSTRRLYRSVPGAQRMARYGVYLMREAVHLNFRTPRSARFVEKLARKHLASQVADPALRAKLTPDYAVGCKRLIVSDDYLPALTRENVEVITEGIREVRPDAVVAQDGTARPVDTIICGTGFRPNDQPISKLIRGTDGRSLDEVWHGSPTAHLGTTVAGFPNLFVMLGPNTGLGHTSVLIMIEAQLDFMAKALRYLRRSGAAALAPRPEAQRAWNAEVDAAMRPTVWAAGGCQSWYQDSSGRVASLWPGTTWAFRRRLSRVKPAEYELLSADSRVDS